MTEISSEQKRNAMWIIACQSMTKLGDVLTNPKTVLTWMLSSVGAPGALLSMLVPIRESGSMLPQLFVSGLVKRASRRKWVFVAGAVAQAVAIALIGLASLSLPPEAAGWVVLVCVAAFAVARSFCSISSKDVLGRTVPKGFRGRVGGLSNSISGVLSASAAVALILYWEFETVVFLAKLVLGASTLWLLGALFYSWIREPRVEGPGEGARDGWLGRLSLVREDPLFRKFIVARALLLGSALASPLLVVLGQQSEGRFTSLVGFIAAAGIASATSSFLWGRLSDRSGALAMAAGGILAAVAGWIGVGVAWSSPAWASSIWTWPAVFLVFNIGYGGVRLGRKTWVVDAVEGDRRTDYVSASNTLIAVLILIIGLVHSPLQAWSPLVSLSLYAAMCVVGAGFALRLHP